MLLDNLAGEKRCDGGEDMPRFAAVLADRVVRRRRLRGKEGYRVQRMPNLSFSSTTDVHVRVGRRQSED